MWSMFIFHGQVLSTVCPCKIARKPPQSQLHPCGVFIKNLTPPSRFKAHPFKEMIFVAFTAHPQDSKCFHTVLNWQDNQRLVQHHRTQPSQHTLHKSAHICIHITWMGPLSTWVPFGVFTLLKGHLACCLSTSLSEDP